MMRSTNSGTRTNPRPVVATRVAGRRLRVRQRGRGTRARELLCLTARWAKWDARRVPALPGQGESNAELSPEEPRNISPITFKPAHPVLRSLAPATAQARTGEALWPHFRAPSTPGNVADVKERSFSTSRTEVRSIHGDSHVGHVSTDGPVGEGGLRFCFNSAALQFVAYEELEAEGYGEFMKLFEDSATQGKHDD